jgi:membrane associated rhomboid family serine protease
MLIIHSEGDRNAKFPWITLTLIAMNLFVFGVQLLLGPEATEGLFLVPKEIRTGTDIVGTQKITLTETIEDEENRDAFGRPIKRVIKEDIEIKHYPGPVPIYMTFLTSIFMHAGWAHLLGNMWFLWVFGRNVESAMDHALYLLFYLVCGVGAGVVHILFDTNSIIPCLGASGAISGVMAAYASIYPFNTVKIWLGWLIGTIEVPALFVVGFWVALQWIYGMLDLNNAEGVGGVAYGAHLGGFAAGMVFYWSLLGYLRMRQAQQDEAGHEPSPETEQQLAAAQLRQMQTGGFPQPPMDVYDFGQYYTRPTDNQPQAGVSGPRPVDLGEFYPKR